MRGLDSLEGVTFLENPCKWRVLNHLSLSGKQAVHGCKGHPL